MLKIAHNNDIMCIDARIVDVSAIRWKIEYDVYARVVVPLWQWPYVLVVTAMSQCCRVLSITRPSDPKPPRMALTDRYPWIWIASGDTQSFERTRLVSDPTSSEFKHHLVSSAKISYDNAIAARKAYWQWIQSKQQLLTSLDNG